MVIRIILFLVATVSFVSTDRERLKCTLTILKSAENSNDHNFFLHFEKFLLRHETGEVLSGFLDKGNLTVGIRYVITTDNKIKLDYLFLKIVIGSNEKGFLASAMHNMDKKKFLKSVRNALYKAYYGADSKDKSNENFDAMLEDNVIGSYLKKIKIRPLIMYTEMSVTSVGIDLNLIEISSADNDTCFLNKLHKRKTMAVEDETTSSSQGEKQTTQIKLRSLGDTYDMDYTDETENSDEKSSSCTDKKKSIKEKQRAKKRRINVEDETDCPNGKNKKSNKKKTKKRKIDVKDDTGNPHKKNKKQSKKRKIDAKYETEEPCKKNKKETKKRRNHVKRKSNCNPEDEIEETDEDSEEVELETRIIKMSNSSTGSKLFWLLADEINNSDKNKNDEENDENKENEDTDNAEGVRIQERSLITAKEKSATEKNNKSSKKRKHLDIETHKHITEHLVSDEEEEGEEEGEEEEEEGEEGEEGEEEENQNIEGRSEEESE